MRAFAVGAVIITTLVLAFLADVWNMESAKSWGWAAALTLMLGGAALLWDWNDKS